MKKIIIKFIKSLNHLSEVRYSGETKTLYLEENLHIDVINKFGYALPFKLGILSDRELKPSRERRNSAKYKPMSFMQPS